MNTVNFVPQPSRVETVGLGAFGRAYKYLTQKVGKRTLITSLTVLAVFGLGLGVVVSQGSGPVLFGVQDNGGSDSQFFSFDLGANVFTNVGPEHEKHDIESMDFRPGSCELYAIAGGGGNKDGKLYTVDKTTGALSLVASTGATGSQEIVAASFDPSGTLWAAQEDVGLVTVDLSTGQRTVQFSYTEETGDNWEGLAWDNAGDFIYGAEGSKLFRFDPSDSTVDELCTNLPSPTEALEFSPDDVLMGGQHDGSQFNLYAVDPGSCGISSVNHNIPEENDDIESITFDVCHVPPLPNPCAGNHPPRPAISPLNEVINLGESITFSAAQSSDPDGDPLTFEWLIDGTQVATGESFTYTAEQGGTFTIELIASDGCTTNGVATQLKVKQTGFCALELSKIDDVIEVLPGGTINYTIELENTGTANCTGTGVEMIETYDPRTTFISAQPSPDQQDNYWNFQVMEPGAKHIVNIEVQVSAEVQAGDVIHNEVCVWAAELHGQPVCTTEDTPVQDPNVPFCELTITKTDTPDPVRPGDELYYTVHVESTGTAICTGGGVELQEYYDPQTTFSHSGPAPSSGDDNWILGELEPGDERFVNIAVDVSDEAEHGDVLVNEACTWAEQFGPKSDPDNWVCVKEETTVDACVGNQLPTSIIDPQDATITLGESITLTSLSTDPDGDDLTFLWAVNQLNILEDGSETFSFTPPEVGSYIVTLKVADGCGQHVSWTTVFVEEPQTSACELVITKTDDVAEVNPSGQIVYTIDLSNTGEAQCTAVAVTDTYDALTSFVSSVPDPSVGNNSWDFGDLAPGESQSISITVDVSSSAQDGDVLQNEACVNANEIGTAVCDTEDTPVVTEQCVGKQNPEPVIDPVSETIMLGQSITFSAASSSDPDGDSLSFAWVAENTTINFSEIGTGEEFSITPPEVGTYTIALMATDECGEATVVTTLTVEDEPIAQCVGNHEPVAVIDPSEADAQRGGVVEFSAAQSSDEDGDDLVFHWFFNGDEIPHNNEILVPDSGDLGDHTILLVVEDVKPDGTVCSEAEATAILHVKDGNGGGGCPGGLPIIATSGDQKIILGDPVTVDASGTINAAGGTLNYEWRIDDLSLSSTEAIYTFTPDRTGTFIAQLFVRNSCGQAIDSVHIVVDPLTPTIFGDPDPEPDPDPPTIFGGDPPPEPEPTPPTIFGGDPEPTPPPVVAGDTTVKGVSDGFDPPVSSPRAGSPVPITAAGVGILGGLFSGGGTFLTMAVRGRRSRSSRPKRKVPDMNFGL